MQKFIDAVEELKADVLSPFEDKEIEQCKAHTYNLVVKLSNAWGSTSFYNNLKIVRDAVRDLGDYTFSSGYENLRYNTVLKHIRKIEEAVKNKEIEVSTPPVHTIEVGFTAEAMEYLNELKAAIEENTASDQTVDYDLRYAVNNLELNINTLRNVLSEDFVNMGHTMEQLNIVKTAFNKVQRLTLDKL